MQQCVVFFLMMLYCVPPVFALNWFQTQEQQAQTAFQKGQYHEAAQLFHDPYRRGVALYHEGQYAQAAEEFSKSTRPEVQWDALYNLGNAYFQQGQYDKAMEAYQKVLVHQPDHEDASHNLQLAKKRLLESKQSNQKDSSHSPSSPQNNPSQDPSSENNSSQDPSSQNNPSQNNSSRQHSPKTDQSSQGSSSSQSQQEHSSPSEKNHPTDLSQPPNPSHALTDKKTDQKTLPEASQMEQSSAQNTSSLEKKDLTRSENQNNQQDFKKNSPPPLASSQEHSKEDSASSATAVEALKKTEPSDHQISPPKEGTARLDTTTDVLLEQLNDNPRQLLRGQLYIDAYHANPQKSDKPW